jgi:PncC family amidohydrolase
MRNYIKKIKKIRESKIFHIFIAESCTGGLLSSKLTSLSGSSDFFEGSVVTYSNYLKNRLLKVPNTLISKYGAVSHQTALSMVKGLKKISKSEILISVTGVAGPNGGNSKTPVGCVYFGLGIKIKNKYRFTTIKKNFREKSRQKIQEKSAEFILKEIIKNLSKI